MVVSEELLFSSEDCVSPGVDGAVKLEGEGESEGVGFGMRGVGTPTRFGSSIKRRWERNERTVPKTGFGCRREMMMRPKEKRQPRPPN